MIKRRPKDQRPRGDRKGYLVYSVAMAYAAKDETTILGDLDGGGYVHRFTRDEHGGHARWGWRISAQVFKTLPSAIACALLVSEHTGVGQAVVLDARTQERVR